MELLCSTNLITTFSVLTHCGNSVAAILSVPADSAYRALTPDQEAPHGEAFGVRLSFLALSLRYWLSKATKWRLLGWFWAASRCALRISTRHTRSLRKGRGRCACI